MKKFVLNLLAIALLLPSLTLLAQTQGTEVIRYGDVRHPVRDREGMVASSNILASEVGARVLADGGNAVDAAVAVGFALAVVRPRAGNIGGGGFMLVYSAEDGATAASKPSTSGLSGGFSCPGSSQFPLAHSSR